MDRSLSLLGPRRRFAIKVVRGAAGILFSVVNTSVLATSHGVSSRVGFLVLQQGANGLVEWRD
jgi:hypothetical protein